MLDFLFNLVIGPLKFIFEFLYSIFYKITGSYGFSIVLLSLCMNILVLPLYRRADAIQDEENRIEKKLEKGVVHIKKTFKGDERYMMLQTYYRQNNYKPSYVLRGLLPLLLEIPFFMAAYSFLSNLQCLSGAAFGPITNLIEQDKLLFGINVLPVLMTIINIVSSSIYSKDAPLKSRIQLYLMATVFLVLLYDSPSGLVLYWTLNNIFSLVKNIITKTRDPKKLINVGLAIVGACFVAAPFVLVKETSIIRKAAICIVGLLLELPLLSEYVHIQLPVLKNNGKKTNLLFFSSCLFLAIFIGLYIPLTVIKSSPAEFIDYVTLENPLSYVFSSFTLGLGIFVIWLGIYYLLSNKQIKPYFAYVIFSICVVAVINYLLFETDLGNMSKSLTYDEMFTLGSKIKLINLAVDGIVLVLIYLLWSKVADIAKVITLALCVALIATSIITIKGTTPAIEENINVVANSKNAGVARARISKTGKNVVIIMLDRGISEFVPYMFEEKPELYEIYNGFTYYGNTLAYGTSTNVSTPSLFGGYEYTPENIQKRDDESLLDKHNEALKVLPVLFSENGFDTTVCNPSYANYKWIPDLSIFDEYENIKAYNTNNGELVEGKTESLSILKRNLFCYGLFRTMPTVLKNTIYDEGNYQSMANVGVGPSYDDEALNEISKNNFDFADNFIALDKLDEVAQVSDIDENTYLSIVNDLTHEPYILQEPDYMPAVSVDNSEYDKEHAIRYSWDGQEMEMTTDYQRIHYQTDMCALIKIGEWLEYLKDNDCYDNTRIIICSDHGRDLDLFDLGIESEVDEIDVISYHALLMVKDFNSNEFNISDEFMTLADIPTILTEDLIENPVNPFTGKKIENSAKNGEIHVMESPWDVEENNGNTFIENTKYKVDGHVLDIDSWTDITGK